MVSAREKTARGRTCSGSSPTTGCSPGSTRWTIGGSSRERRHCSRAISRCGKRSTLTRWARGDHGNIATSPRWASRSGISLASCASGTSGIRAYFGGSGRTASTSTWLVYTATSSSRSTGEDPVAGRWRTHRTAIPTRVVRTRSSTMPCAGRCSDGSPDHGGRLFVAGPGGRAEQHLVGRFRRSPWSEVSSQVRSATFVLRPLHVATGTLSPSGPSSNVRSIRIACGGGCPTTRCSRRARSPRQ